MERPFIGVLDYGRGNLRSVAKALAAVGAQVRVSDRPAALKSAAGLLVPGVGAFGDAITALRARGMDALLRGWVANDRPLLGVCLGLQLFCRDSDEFGLRRGFGFFDLPVRRFPRTMRTPHMGWNGVDHDAACPLFEGVAQGAPFYFVHSYRVAACAGAAGVTEYGGRRFASALWRGRLFATQFHPEKSQADGLKLYRNFWGICRRHGRGRGGGA